MNMREPQTGGAGGSLHLPKDIGVAASVAQAIENRWHTAERVDEWMQKHGIGRNPEPDIECPVVTAEILLTTDWKQYTTVYAAQLRWFNYVTRLLAAIRAVILEVDNEMGDISAARRTHFRQMNEGKGKGGKMSAGEMEDTISQDPHFRDLRLQLQQLTQQKLKVEAEHEALDRNMKTISRQIENRRAEAEGGRREGNMPQGQWRGGSVQAPGR
jgi:hypothetical protein